MNVEWNIAGPLIDELRDGSEGASVGICCDNPDVAGPNSCITVTDDWTRWIDKPFYGDSVIACLEAAVTARKEAQCAARP